MARRTRQNWDCETERAVRSLDDLAAYEEFCEAIPSRLRRWVLDGWSADRMRRECAALIQAQGISKALRGDIRAIQDVLNRYEGTAIKRVESKNVYAQMSKQELVALAFQKLKDAGLLESPETSPETQGSSSSNETPNTRSSRAVAPAKL